MILFMDVIGLQSCSEPLGGLSESGAFDEQLSMAKGTRHRTLFRTIQWLDRRLANGSFFD